MPKLAIERLFEIAQSQNTRALVGLDQLSRIPVTLFDLRFSEESIMKQVVTSPYHSSSHCLACCHLLVGFRKALHHHLRQRYKRFSPRVRLRPSNSLAEVQIR